MNFLIQGLGDFPAYNFGYELIHSLREQEEDFDREWQICADPFKRSNFAKWCPVGSVEFVHKYFENNGIPIPAPINVPSDLWTICGLRPRLVKSEKCLGKDCFVKSADQIKHPLNGVMSKTPSSGLWQVTDLVSEGFVSEWRCFVFNQRLLDVKNYSGDWYKVPDKLFILEAIDLWKSAPPAYTLDIGVTNNGNSIIECHNFYSCGLYGFSFRSKYPQMLSQWYSWWLRENLKE